MHPLVLGQHFNKLSDAPSSSLRLLSSMNTKKNGVTIHPIQTSKEFKIKVIKNGLRLLQP